MPRSCLSGCPRGRRLQAPALLPLLLLQLLIWDQIQGLQASAVPPQLRAQGTAAVEEEEEAEEEAAAAPAPE